MQTARRIYVYSAFLAGLSATVNGWIQTLSALWVASGSAFHTADALAGGLASLLVGVPVMVGHWLWAQRLAREHPAERTSWVRALALHLAWAVPWLIALYTLLGLSERLLCPWVRSSCPPVFWRHDLLVVLTNGGVGAFFAFLNFKERGQPQQVLRRVQGWLWGLHALALTTKGLFVLGGGWSTPPDWRLPRALGWLGMGLVLGLLVWPWWRRWGSDQSEQASSLHGTLVLLTALTALTVAAAGTVSILTALGLALGGQLAWQEAGRRTLQELGGHVLPWLVVLWGMGRRWRSMEARWGFPRGRLARARAEALAALEGLGMGAWGGTLLFRALWTAWLQGTGLAPWARGAALALVGWPLWALMWHALQRDARAQGEMGEVVRGSLGRKGVLYGALLGSVLALMTVVGLLAYHLLLWWLAGSLWPGVEWLSMLSAGGVALGVGLIHWVWLRQDQAWEAKQRAQRRSSAAVLLLSDGTSPLLGLLQERLRLYLPQLQVRRQDLDRGLPQTDENLRAVVLLGHTLSALPEPWRLWFQRFSGPRLVLPTGGPWLWVGAPDGEALLNEALDHLQALAWGPGAWLRERMSWRQGGFAFLGLLVWALIWGSWLFG